MDNFEEYWESNKEQYKALAKKDFDQLKNGQFVADVNIRTDDDFALDIGETFQVLGNSKKDVSKKLIKKLKDAQFTYCKTWGIIKENVETKGDYSHTWFNIRDAAIETLKAGAERMMLGGNQTIEIFINEVVPDIKQSLKKIKP